MSGSSVFEFGSGSVASAYDDVLVPVIFVPWATRLVEEGPRWEGATVLDLATGTGVLAQRIAERVGAEGRVIGADINAEMLAFARRRCAGLDPEVSFVETAAYPLDQRGGTTRRNASTPKIIAYRMKPAAKITPAWKPPPGPKSP